MSRLHKEMGMRFFRCACACILLHELGHLKLRHSYSIGCPIAQEREADRFAAEWLLGDAADSSEERKVDRLCALIGIALALLWLTIFNVYLGQKNAPTHPEGYD